MTSDSLFKDFCYPDLQTKIISSGTRLPGFKSQLLQLIAVHSWWLRLSVFQVLIYKMRIIIAPTLIKLLRKLNDFVSITHLAECLKCGIHYPPIEYFPGHCIQNCSSPPPFHCLLPWFIFLLCSYYSLTYYIFHVLLCLLSVFSH